MYTVAFLLIPEFSLINVVAAMEILRVANTVLETPAYRCVLVTDSTLSVPSSGGICLPTDVRLTDLEQFDLLLVCGSFKAHKYEKKETLSRIRRFAHHGKALGSMESGIYHLARAGVLDGRTVATHYAILPVWAKKFPKVRFVNTFYTDSKDRVSSAGGLSSIDLMLHIIERRQGSNLARRVESLLLAPRMRSPDDLQSDALTRPDNRLPQVVRMACKMMEENLAAPLALTELARRVGFSRRHLDRVITRAFSQTASDLYLSIRLSRARKLLRSSGLDVAVVAETCGFGNYSHFARCYKRLFARSPSAERRVAVVPQAGQLHLLPVLDLHPDQNLLDPQRLL